MTCHLTTCDSTTRWSMVVRFRTTPPGRSWDSISWMADSAADNCVLWNGQLWCYPQECMRPDFAAVDSSPGFPMHCASQSKWFLLLSARSWKEAEANFVPTASDNTKKHKEPVKQRDAALSYFCLSDREAAKAHWYWVSLTDSLSGNTYFIFECASAAIGWKEGRHYHNAMNCIQHRKLKKITKGR